MSTTTTAAAANADEQCDGNGGGATSLAEDEAFEMLTHVSLDDLDACRDVCTHWRRLTYEPAFAPLHRRRAAGFVSGYLVQGLARNRYSATFVSSTSGAAAADVSLDFLPCSPSVRLEAVSAHRGLACCVDPAAAAEAFSLSSGGKPITRRRCCYYVCKPATKQWRSLPSPRLRFPTAATAMIAPPAGAADFKILRLSIPALRDSLRCEIFDSRRKRGGWRRSSDVPLWPESLAGAGPAVRAHGAMHWLRWPGGPGGGEEDIFAFDMRSETWRLVPIPPELEERAAGARKKLAAAEGRLCLVAVADDGEAEVWVVAGYGGRAERWEKKMMVRLENLTAMDGRQLVFRDLCSSDIALLNTVYTVIWYDFLKGKKIAEVPVHHKCIQQVFKYESDLVPWDI